MKLASLCLDRGNAARPIMTALAPKEIAFTMLC